MGLPARQVTAFTVQKGLASERPAHGAVVAALSRHTFFQQCAQQPRNAGILPGGLDARPLRNLFFEGNGHIAELRSVGHENSVTRK